MRNSVYVTINENYTATVYSLKDLKEFVKSNKFTYGEYGKLPIDPSDFKIHEEESGNKVLTEEIKEYIAKSQQPTPEEKRKILNNTSPKQTKRADKIFHYTRISSEHHDLANYYSRGAGYNPSKESKHRKEANRLEEIANRLGEKIEASLNFSEMAYIEGIMSVDYFQFYE